MIDRNLPYRFLRGQPLKSFNLDRFEEGADLTGFPLVLVFFICVKQSLILIVHSSYWTTTSVYLSCTRSSSPSGKFSRYNSHENCRTSPKPHQIPFEHSLSRRLSYPRRRHLRSLSMCSLDRGSQRGISFDVQIRRAILPYFRRREDLRDLSPDQLVEWCCRLFAVLQG